LTVPLHRLWRFSFHDRTFSIDPQAVRVIRAESKAQILDTLADCFAAVYRLDRAQVQERIEERESLGSTGFGRGVAIPHARLDGLSRPVAVFLRLEEPVDFDSADGMPVDCVFGLLSPEQAGAVHLQALAAISRLMRDDRMHQRLSSAPDADALYAVLVNVIDRDAA
jgi:PTS system nitrogen regulatory IIA component